MLPIIQMCISLSDTGVVPLLCAHFCNKWKMTEFPIASKMWIETHWREKHNTDSGFMLCFSFFRSLLTMHETQTHTFSKHWTESQVPHFFFKCIYSFIIWLTTKDAQFITGSNRKLYKLGFRKQNKENLKKTTTNTHFNLSFNWVYFTCWKSFAVF